MKPTPVIAIFDVGKTNKKLFLFDEDYKIVYEKSARFNETTDEDGFPCENIDALRLSLFESLREVFRLKEFDIKAINFSTYGASFVYVNDHGEPIAPLYNYLKPYSPQLKEKFYSLYEGEEEFARKSASPVLESLNSGMQLYRIKYEKPELFAQTKYALHLPQYMSFAVTGEAYSDVTSIGCHTNLWDFDQHQYHQWVFQEDVIEKLPPIAAADHITRIDEGGRQLAVGIGLHDSSAALIPYLANFSEPFMLLSTGTWCISLNPFNQSLLTTQELKQDCLCYMDYHGRPVKASRVFAGHEHEVQTKRIAAHYNTNIAKYKTVEYDPELIAALKANKKLSVSDGSLQPFAQANLNALDNDVLAYHYMIYDLVQQQTVSSQLVLKDTAVKRIFVDGGFSKNQVYMNLLATAFSSMEVFAASMPQATSLGTALAIHKHWNHKPLPTNMIELNYYAVNQYI